jgi:hypothetical protein
MSNFVPGIGKTILASASTVSNLDSLLATAGLTGQVGLAADYGLPRSLVHTNYGSIAPRVGFAWRLFGNNRTVLRSGFGIFTLVQTECDAHGSYRRGFPFRSCNRSPVPPATPRC